MTKKTKQKQPPFFAANRQSMKLTLKWEICGETFICKEVAASFVVVLSFIYKKADSLRSIVSKVNKTKSVICV